MKSLVSLSSGLGGMGILQEIVFNCNDVDTDLISPLEKFDGMEYCEN